MHVNVFMCINICITIFIIRSSMKGVAVVVKYSSYLKWMTIVVVIYMYYILLDDINNIQRVGSKNPQKCHSLEYSPTNVVQTAIFIEWKHSSACSMWQEWEDGVGYLSSTGRGLHPCTRHGKHSYRLFILSYMYPTINIHA